MDIDDLLDTMVGVLIVAALLLSLGPLMAKMLTENYGGFNTQIEKTAIKTDKELVTIERYYSRADILLMISVTDEYEPEPKEFDINGLPIVVDESFLQNRIPALVKVNNHLAISNDIKYKLEVVPSNTKTTAERWKFTKI